MKINKTLSDLGYCVISKNILLKQKSFDELANAGKVLEDGEVKYKKATAHSDVYICDQFISFSNYIDYEDGSFRPNHNLTLTIDEMKELIKLAEVSK